MADDHYPPGPTGVPADFTAPSPAYRRHAYLAVAGLVLFLTLYLALAAWFGWSAYRLLDRASSRHGNLGHWLAGLGAAFLTLFMAKALVFVRRGRPTDDLEITAADHPALFAFLHRLADDARAPRPHRVYLSPQVNAAVFYDLTVLNLLFPSRKNLVIGLGLVNVLDLTELKAVLGHELGHFAQRSMAVGRWVYTAQQIAGHVVAKRDSLDGFLRWLSSFDLRVAWIGWILRTIVWSIRSLVETLFGWVILAERALSREMELQADRVAVSLTGSDPLIDALHRLGAADDAMDRALRFAAGQASQGKRVEDLFALQAELIVRKRAILADPTWGEVPPIEGDPARHRVFTARLAHPPQMWSTHPPSTVREDHAKQVYLTAPADHRSAWTLFREPAKVRAAVTATLYADEEKPTRAVPAEETMAALAESFAKRQLDPVYRGAYLGRSPVRAAATVEALYEPRSEAENYGPATASATLAADLAALYPASLGEQLARVRSLAEEKGLLRALARGVAEAPGGVIRFRDRELHRRELPAVVAEVERELTAAEREVTAHDRRTRSLHRAAARAAGPGWEEHVVGLAAVLHYADHRGADLADAVGALENVLAVVLADGKVSPAEADRVVLAAIEVRDLLAEVHHEAGEVALGPTLSTALELASWAEAMGPFKLPAPTRENLGPWLEVAPSWWEGTLRALGTLSSAALDQLLAAEEEVSVAVAAGHRLPPAPAPARPPSPYAVRLPGDERPRQERLGWWDRFQTADGLVPGALRLAVAGSVIGLVIWAGR